MAKRILLGCSVLALVAVVGVAVLAALNWNRVDLDGMGRARDDRLSLARQLAAEFGGEPRVDLVCVFPVVGVAPCIVDSDAGTREVTLTYANHAAPAGTSPEEHARRIAERAMGISAFVRGSDRIDVVFEENSGSSSVSRTYGFSPTELGAGAP